MVRNASGFLRLDDGLAVDGGFKISGSWPWASGVDSAAWLILAAVLVSAVNASVPRGESTPFQTPAV